MNDTGDIAILRDLAREYADIAAKPVQDQRRDLWRRHNSLERTIPPIYVRWFSCIREVMPPLQCRDPFFRSFEHFFRERILQDQIGDDFIIEPWVSSGAVYAVCGGEDRWGPVIRHSTKTAERGSWKFVPVLENEEDLAKLVAPRHAIDEPATAERHRRLRDAIGDLVTVNAERGPAFRMWRMDISTDLAQLIGLEQFMLYMLDRPAWLHRLLAFMRDGILAMHEQAERAGDWRLCHHENQAMPYALELEDPSPAPRPVRRRQLWGFCASQETTLVSPAMFEEFMLQYQMPILAHFGLVAYGCCENLTPKLDRLRKLPNLRRIAVTPWADVARCAEQIGRDYVFSWRPSPAEMICTGFDPAKVRRLTQAGLEASKGCIVDITLKDVETIDGAFENLVEWTRIVRDVAAAYA